MTIFRNWGFFFNTCLNVGSTKPITSSKVLTGFLYSYTLGKYLPSNFKTCLSLLVSKPMSLFTYNSVFIL